MKHSLLIVMGLLLLCPMQCIAVDRTFRMAVPGYQYNFPRDHASHEDFKTEWWYYTGHLNGADGSKYGYELTFFRSGMNVAHGVPSSSAWAVDNVYLAHFAVSDINARRFFHEQRLNRSGVGFAGAKSDTYDVWNLDWQAKLSGEQHLLTASDKDYKIDLTLTPEKPPVIHGENGVSQKASCYGCASHYYSFTRLNTAGTITVKGRAIPVTGLSWMDHEFGSNQLTKDQVGWDWFSIQLNDKTELMLYQMRLKDHAIDKNSSGTFVFQDGRSAHLKNTDYSVKALGSWHSNATGATYPMGWQVSIPSQNLSLKIQPDMLDQELVKQQSTDVTYWEGASTVDGTVNGKPIKGQAYVEMTGYAEQFSKHI